MFHKMYLRSRRRHEHTSYFTIQCFYRDGWDLVLLLKLCYAHFYVIHNSHCLATFSGNNHNLRTLLEYELLQCLHVFFLLGRN